jgi:hypothetical protein
MGTTSSALKIAGKPTKSHELVVVLWNQVDEHKNKTCKLEGNQTNETETIVYERRERDNSRRKGTTILKFVQVCPKEGHFWKDVRLKISSIDSTVMNTRTNVKKCMFLDEEQQQRKRPSS